ncbi:ROK family protein [Pectinatus frisingensis]|uniref:ROK family protein n=1 Tax=Pectinatus frisingensis TaxID=865 RepID=UPI0018C7AD29|nr:ROK family protein [Pectinatus frisingensis]
MDKKDLRNKNLELLRSCLKQVRQATKPQLSKYTGLSVVTVNSLLHELLLSGEAFATDEAESSGGRRARTYSFNARRSLALIVYMHERAGHDTVFISVDDLLGNTIDFSELQPEQINFDYFCKVLSPYFKRYPQILVVAIGLPGVVVKDKLIVIDYPQLKNTAFCRNLSARLNCPVIFENDINAAVAGYACSLGVKCQSETIVGIYFPQNYLPGAGIFLRGSLYKGRDGIAGEIGHYFRAAKLKKKMGTAVHEHKFMQKVAQVVLFFTLTWNPDSVVIYNEKLRPMHAKMIKELCTQELAEEFLPKITIKADIYEDYGRGIRSLATAYLDNKN